MADRKTFFVDVVLPVPINQLFTYRVPFELNDQIQFGVRAIVPFGKSKLHSAIIVKIHENAPQNYTAKYLEFVLDESPIIQSYQFNFWKWIANYYMASIGEVMNAALPTNLKLASETKIQLHPEFDKQNAQLSDKEYLIIEALEIQEILDLNEISQIVRIKTIHPLLKKLYDKGYIVSVEDVKNKFAVKTRSHVATTDFFQNHDNLQSLLKELEIKKSSQKQVEVLLLYLNEVETNGDPILKKRLEDLGATSSAIASLARKGVLDIMQLDISRLKNSDGTIGGFKALSDPQSVALNELRSNFKDNLVNLFFGVTGSGKTEVYVELIREKLNEGKQVLFLLPEIALTTQLITRLQNYFGDLVGVYHSKFNQNERVEIWNAVLRNDPNKFRIVLGARSSVFLPFAKLGMIIVDEEHETSYKQFDPAPRYNARDLALVLGAALKIPVLLGSATPSFESYYNAKTGKYGYVELTERFGKVKLPEIFCADMKKELIQKTVNGPFSKFLIDHFEETINSGKQVILFQNRRGYTPYWICELCSWIPQCKNCDVTLTYHKQSNTLKCHYCSFTVAPMGSCSNCGSNKISMMGFGTEKIEDELSLLYPNVRFSRMDMDSVKGKKSYEQILSDFESRNVHVLIGTQMISKGLDFDNVGLVGVLDADMLLKRTDFRAVEKAYQLMSQVAGRAGRKKERGKVVIQTSNPDNWVIQKVIAHDYQGFYKSEIVERKNFFYPPFFKIIDISLKHKDIDILNLGSQNLADKMKEVFKERVLGPEFPVIPRIQNYFIKQIRLRYEREVTDKKIKERLNEILAEFQSVPHHKSIRVSIDVDPA